MNHFRCKHCGKNFQLETLEAKECPSCFWSTSVERMDGSLTDCGVVKMSKRDWNKEIKDFAPILNFTLTFLTIVFLATFLPGFFRNVINGKMTTQQYYDEVYVPEMKQIPPKIEKTINDLQGVFERVTNRTPPKKYKIGEYEVEEIPK